MTTKAAAAQERRRTKTTLLTISVLVAVLVVVSNKFSMLLQLHREPTTTIETTMTQQLAPPPQLESMQTVFHGIKARAFEPWNKPIPCFEPEKFWKNETVVSTPTSRGFFMAKCVKAASTTAASVHMRIARSAAKAKRSIDEICRIRYTHATANALRYRDRSKTHSFLWTVIRDPTERAISHFFFEKVSRRKEEPFDANFQEFVSRPHNVHHFLYFLSLDPNYDPTIIDPARDVRIANQILEEFDFIGSVERMDESIVALQLVLGLPTRDVLHLDSKASFDAGGGPNGCSYVVPSFVSPGMRAFFESKNWTDAVAVETALHRAVHASLDLTIRRLGPRRFDAALSRYRTAQEAVKKQCDHPDAFPCSTSGGKKARKGLCTISDMGCGTKCIDRIADELGLPEYGI